jgi:hypothetical protein
MIIIHPSGIIRRPAMVVFPVDRAVHGIGIPLIISKIRALHIIIIMGAMQMILQTG